MTDPHGGNLLKLALKAGKPPEEILDFSANINPLGPPEWLRPLIGSRIQSLAHYPDPDCTELLDVFAKRFGLSRDEVIAGNGSTEILYLLPRVIRAARAVIPVPSYADYARAAELSGLPVLKIGLPEENGFVPTLSLIDASLRKSDLVMLGQPNNPTGMLFDASELRDLIARHPRVTFIIDESFLPFIDGAQSLMTDRPPNAVVLMSLTKFYAMPGLRLGCAAANRAVIAEIKRIMPPWSVNAIAQAAGVEALQDHRYAVQSRNIVRRERQWLQKELARLPGLKVFPGRANFLLVKRDRPFPSAAHLAESLLAHGIAIRVCGNFDGLDEQYFRIAVRTREENTRLRDALCRALGKAVNVRPAKKAKALMIQATGSNAGKSVLVAAFCRILAQDGYRVAPFKAQNMSLNSYVTQNGGEMGRAQAVQAQAAGLDPDVRMNPALLKPVNDQASQIILRGKPVGNMDFRDYVRFRPKAFAAAKEDFDALAAEYDAVLMEGAGSPAEINLKKNDMVNMNMALYAHAPVLLAGDIDRGGVYASFIGTMEVFTEAERNLVAGFLVNRFRGHKTLLTDAHRYLEKYTGRKVLGVVPYLHDLGLPDEDSVSFKEGRETGRIPREDHVVVAVVDLPHISNFTDFDALAGEPDVWVKVVRRAKDLGAPDAVILPGSKNVMEDLGYLKKTGLDQKISALAAGKKTQIVGICGGFQMLGREIADPGGLESAPGSKARALGLLPVVTHLFPDKTLKRCNAKHVPSGLTLCGYEIHHGLTGGGNLTPAVQTGDGETIGLAAQDGHIWGTYLHGLFDADAFRRWFVDRLRLQRGLPACGKIRALYDLEPAFDRLAAAVRENVDMKAIYKILGLP